MPRKVLVLFGHPAYERSRINRRLAKVARDLEGVTFHDLYEVYPDLVVDVRREQKLLLEHDTVVFQHPFFWYSSPALVKEWTDQVLEHGWAYGSGGTALAGKVMMIALTTGGGADAYRKEGYNRFTIRELLRPQEQTAHLCHMRFLAPFVVHDAFRLDKQGIADEAARYRRTLEALVTDRVDLDRAEQAEAFDDGLIGSSTSNAEGAT